jgi:hypothetical protein
MHHLPLLSRTCQIIAIQAAVALVAISPSSAAAPAQRAAPSKLPSLATVKTIVEHTLGKDRNYRPGDMLTQSRVTSVLAQLKAAGWEVPQGRELLLRIPADNEYLIRTLSTKKGVAFMRAVSTMSEGYDRVDRLSRLPNGQQLVERLIAGPDGHKMIAYLTESRGGKELGAMLGSTVQGVDFNRPTGRIYTEKQLLDVLEKLYVAQAK